MNRSTRNNPLSYKMLADGTLIEKDDNQLKNRFFPGEAGGFPDLIKLLY
ncbi:MAG TPA: hypothetical protein P5032_19235 [Candidatus Competibacter sp.]|nr:hypothetical protein [Candidatus Competibacter sp.]